MKSLRVLFVFIILFILGYHHHNNVVQAAKNRNTVKRIRSACDHKAMESCSKKLTMIGDEKFIFPTNIKQMEKRCRDIKPLQRCVKNNAQNCYDPDTNRYILILLYSITKTNRAYCRNSKKRQSFLNFGKCANKNIKHLNKYMAQLNRDFHSIRHLNKEQKLAIPLLCCNYHKFKTDIENMFENDCPENLPEVENILNGYVGDLLNAGCGDYGDDNDRCDSVIEKTPNWTKPLEHKDFIIPLVQIIDQLQMSKNEEEN
ncbi:hypothetical protein DERP_001096 [Dermatophagoides pteronyssinus]|uniref:Uncharacterized protein n=1 Tax=Dermatophagoides pteronyssinus TaxID=6956 RepID=A0ABQ8JDH5_DERPT|nr:hypothetical protein DERP_001096 [Dermatophagoides pteronyssinus]